MTKQVDKVNYIDHGFAMNDILIQPFVPEAADAVVHHHGVYYARHWAFDDRFEAQVSREFSTFIREFDAHRDGFWWAANQGDFAGSIAVDGSRSGAGQARIRWFIVPELYQGKGVGGRLLDAAMAFCRERQFHTVHLWTFAGLDAARALYERNGFQLVEEAVGDGWGPVITEQKFVVQLRPSP